MTNSPWPTSPSRMITVPGSKSMPFEALDELHLLLVVERLEQRRRGQQVLEQPLARETVQALGQRRHLGDQLLHGRAFDLEQVGLADDLHGRGARLLGDQRHLAEQRPFVQAPAFDRLRRPGRAREHAQLAAGDEVERRADLALADHQLAVAGAHQAQRLRWPSGTAPAAAPRRTARAGTARGIARTPSGRARVPAPAAPAPRGRRRRRRPPVRCPPPGRWAPAGPRTWPARARRARSSWP